tara:strand:+ start:13 stop:408 length:396 start_codon:yes stop_codon:yes gene_type:complete
MPEGFEYRPEIVPNDYNINKLNSYNEAQMNMMKNKIFLNDKNDTLINDNKFMNMTIYDIYGKIKNLMPNLYKDYHKKYLENSLKLKNKDKFTTRNTIVRETILDMIFNNENMIYLGIIIILISFLLYMINL